nr:DNA cytosine methyltransferase [Rhizobium sp. Khangiran2]
MTTSEDKIVAVDLFCGVGGLTHGLERAGIDVRLGVDKDPDCQYPFEANNSAKFLHADIGQMPASVIRDALDDAPVTLLAGCAPCQPFSTYSRKAKRAGDRSAKRKSHPDDWRLVERFSELVKELSPDLVTMENVPPLATQEVFTNFVDELEKRYWVHYSVVECQTLGLPQTRKRLVLLASRFGPVSLPSSDLPRVTVRQTIGGLPELAAGEVHPEDPLHRACRLSSLNLERIRASKPGGTWRDWPERLLAA